jgi:Pyruvate/2-oxoacid:ferredoxin oxidoreductase delta subunit
MEDVKLGLSLTPDLSMEAEAKQEGTWEPKRILREAGRCLNCESCNLCLQCVSSCPDACIRMEDDKTTITVDLDYCKGCGICAHECLREIITMEEINA